MAGKRQAISKGLRFDIFHRDGFTCQYCGQRPPDVVLELDHIRAVAEGGDNDPINLTTSCADCNRGKSAKRLGNVAPRPDADLKFLEVQQEIAEANRYLVAKLERDKSIGAVIDELENVWGMALTQEYVPFERQWRIWLQYYQPREIEDAIYVASGRYVTGTFGNNEAAAVGNLVRYISAVMRNKREAEGG